MASDVVRVRLHLRQIRVLAVASDTPSELRVEVESTVSPRSPGRTHPDETSGCRARDRRPWSTTSGAGARCDA